MSVQTVTLDDFVDVDTEPESWTSWQRHRLDVRLCETARQIFWDDEDREDYSCPVCGLTDTEFDVHHRDGDRLNNHPINLIAICKRCHRNEHRRRSTIQRVQAMKREFEQLVEGSE